MSDKSDLKAELERKKQRLAQIREEKKRKEEERKKKEVSPGGKGKRRKSLDYYGHGTCAKEWMSTTSEQ